jgi:nucleotide-binding universal stress UspA family protein
MMILKMDSAYPAYRVIWAFDPYASEPDTQRLALMALKEMTEDLDVEVTPVFLYGAHELPQINSFAQKVVNEVTRDIARNGQLHISPIVVIAEPFFRIRNAVQELIHYAKDQRSDCILLNTRARKGVGRLLLGSFAEELSLRSEVPLLVVNPHCDSNVKKKIIFATDFSEESRKAFVQVVELARVSQVALILFHQARYPLPPTIGYAFCPYPLYEGISDDDIQMKRAQAQDWIQQAKRAGVEISVQFEEREKQPFAGILDFTAENPGILAMTARSGRFETICLGSTVRRVLREACCPVWIVHPEQSRIPSLVTDENRRMAA